MENPPRSHQLLAVRWLYFSYFACFGIFISFANVYFREFGLTGTEIGLINSISALAAIFSGPLWGMLSDRIRNPRLVLTISAFGGAAALLILSTASSLAGIVLVTAFYSIFISAIIPLTDSVNLRILGSQSDRYGQQRMWGSLGYIISSSLSGFILQKTGLHALFFGSAACLVLMLPGLAILRTPPAPPQAAPWRGLRQFIRQRNWLVFAGSFLVIGVIMNAMNTFLGIYIKELSGGEALIGNAAALGALVEMPFMYFSFYLLRRLGSRVLFNTGIVFYGLRMLLYAFIPSADWILPIALLNGFSFAFLWIGSVSFSSEMAPENLKATAQGALTSLMSLSSVIGSPINGGLYDWLGSSGMFLVNGVLALVALALFVTGTQKRKVKAEVVP